jgi:polyphosphate kinase
MKRVSVSSSAPASLAASGGVTSAVPTAWLSRDQSIIDFNFRVLDWARREDVPVLERLRYLCIVSSNLDELIEVRSELHLKAFLANDHRGVYTVASFEALHRAAHALVAEQYRLYNDTLMPALALQGIEVITHGQRNAQQRQWVKRYFDSQVKPLLVPVALDPSHPFPQVANKSLNFIVRLDGADAFGRENDIAIVKVPRVLPRVIRLPESVSAKGREQYVLLSSVVRAHLAELFLGRQMHEFSQFRVTRHSDLAVDEDDVRNLRTALRQGLEVRHFGQALRLEVSADCSEHLWSFLLKQFHLPQAAMYQVSGPVNLVRLTQLVDLIDRADLRFAPFNPVWPRQLVPGQPMFEQIAKGDVLLHQPFEDFDAVVQFLREAVEDPQVLAIKQTIYRTGADSELMQLLRQAVRVGKEVTVVVELKARFDEEANINWAETLEAVGVQVVYGVVGLKTHAKMLLVTRREGRQLRRYGHLSTGNYNPRTARLYTDLSYLTADSATTADMDAVFSHIAAQGALPRMRCLRVSPWALHRNLLTQLARCERAAAAGGTARVIIKTNALTDEPLMKALVRAAQAGAQVDLIVRGACMLPAGVPGFTDRLRVRSVVGRFLEHSRVFYFSANGADQLLLSSADWMNRNMMRRVEIAWPVVDPVLRQRIIDECLLTYLADDVDAWAMQADGSHLRTGGQGRSAAGPRRSALGANMSAQERLVALYRDGATKPEPGPGHKRTRLARTNKR